MFNEGRYWERVQEGELVGYPQGNRHPSPPPAFEPYCTVSQSVHYYTRQLKKVAVVHQYLRPDGSLGASHRPDPKAIIVGDVMYVLDPGNNAGQP
jgi:hypothetical protein